jgi:hypothetical protein
VSDETTEDTLEINLSGKKLIVCQSDMKYKSLFDKRNFKPKAKCIEKACDDSEMW